MRDPGRLPVPEFSREPLRRLAGRLPPGVNRIVGLEMEKRFWRRYVQTRGSGWGLTLDDRLDPEAPLTERLILDRLDGLPRELSILDVGAGPLTVLGKRIEGRTVHMTATDPLGDTYRELLAREGVVAPPVATLTCAGEDLLERFGPARFDVAYARNALDHARDPLTIIRNMIALTKPGGLVALRHNRREGERRQYTLLHAWNFDVTDEGPVLFDRRRRFVLRDALGASADVGGHLDRQWACAVIRPKGPGLDSNQGPTP